MNLNTTFPNIELNVDKINLEHVTMSEMNYIQPKISKAKWRAAPGRKLGFLVKYDSSVIGVFCLVSPVINLAERDRYLNMPKDKTLKGKELRKYVDMSICVGLQPLSWYWNIGKLVSLAATSKEVADIYQERYGDELNGITTTSLYGKGSQYNRVYKFLGYTKGYGHEHISDEKYHEMLQYMRENNIEIPSCKFGSGSNPRMRRISAYKKATGESFTMNHGNKRGIYYHDSTDKSFNEIVQSWYDRWGYPRYQRKKNEKSPYQTGLE